MTNHPPILRNSAFAIPLAVIAGALFGPNDAAAAGLSSIVVLANLWLLSVLGPRFVLSVARASDESVGATRDYPAFWGAVLVAKFILMAVAFVGLAQLAPPVGVAMGFLPLLIGTLVTGVQLARADLVAAEEA